MERLDYIYLNHKGKCLYPDTNSWKTSYGDRYSLLLWLDKQREEGAYIIAYLTSDVKELLWDHRLDSMGQESILKALPLLADALSE